MAMTSILTPTRKVDDKGQIKVEAEDNAMVLMDHGNGELSHVQCGFNYFDPYGHEGKGQDRPTISLWGTEGNMALIGYDWAPLSVELATSWTEPPKRFATDAEGYVWEQGASVVAECLSTGKEPLITARHALHVLEIIEAARASQESGRRISLQSTFPWPIVRA
jgi:predicted dehydrogenase